MHTTNDMFSYLFKIKYKFFFYKELIICILVYLFYKLCD